MKKVLVENRIHLLYEKVLLENWLRLLKHGRKRKSEKIKIEAQYKALLEQLSSLDNSDNKVNEQIKQKSFTNKK